jgi:hypothetical protein
MANISNVKVLQGNQLSLSGSTVSVTGTLSTNGNLNVNGTITANQLNINVTTVSSSVIYSSGSTKFGDTTDDTMQITGSVLVNGNIIVASGFAITGSHTGSGAGLFGIPNSGLVNSAITIGTTSISLGSSNTTIQGITVITGSIVTGSDAKFTSVSGAHSGNGSLLTSLNATQLTTGVAAVTIGGTGQTTYTDGQLLIGNTTGNTLTKNTLTAGSGIGITNGNGTITISATGSAGVSSIIGGANIGITNPTGPAVTVSLSSSLTGLTSISASSITASNLVVDNLIIRSSFSATRVTINAPYTIASSDNIIFGNVTSSNNLIVTVPSPTLVDGRQITIKRIDTPLQAGSLRVSCSVNIDDNNIYDIYGPFQSINLISDSGSNKWFVV